MGIRQEAIEKVKKDSFEHGSPQEVLQRLLLAWIEYDEGAAERILAEGKDTKGCYEHIRSCARELHQNSVNAAPEQRESMAARKGRGAALQSCGKLQEFLQSVRRNTNTFL